METKNTLSKIYPILFIVCPQLLVLWLITLNRFSWPGLVAVACVGIASGIVAEVLIVRKKIPLGIYLIQLVPAVIIGILLWVAGALFSQYIAKIIFGWGWWLKDWGIVLKNAILFIPAVISSVFLTIGKKPVSDVIVLILIDPILHLAMLWYILRTLLSCLPT